MYKVFMLAPSGTEVRGATSPHRCRSDLVFVPALPIARPDIDRALAVVDDFIAEKEKGLAFRR